MVLVRVFLVLIALLGSTKSANILGIFPVPSKSHDILGIALFKHLSSIGHNVTYISSFPHKSDENFHHIYVHETRQFKEENMSYTQGNATFLQTFRQVTNFDKLTEYYLENESVQNLIKSDTKFDLMIHFLGIDGTLGLAEHFDIPVIIFSPVSGFQPNEELLGNPSPISYVPHAMLPFTANMNFLERTMNFLIRISLFPALEYISFSNADNLLKKYFPNIPPMKEIRQRIQLVLVNSHISTESPRPYVPNMIQIGGFHLQKPDPLNNELKQILDEAKEGFIYFSFGTNVNIKKLPEEIMGVFRNVLSSLPFKVIMKFEEDSIPNQPKNFYISKWFPQQSVLAHPNIKLFISHGGYGGCTESLYYGVPMICIPFFADQPKNCADAEHNGYSITIQLGDLNEERFSEAVRKVLYDQRFKEAVKFKSELYRDQPMNPMDKATYWIEHVIKHKGAKHLRVKGADLNWIEYNLIDVFLFIGTVLSVIFFVSFITCKCIFKKVFKSKNKQKIN